MCFFKKCCNLQTKQTVFIDFIIWNKSFIIFSVNIFPLHFLIQALNKWIFPLYMINLSRQFDTCCNCKTSKAIDVQVSTIYWLISNSSTVTCRWKYVVLIILFFFINVLLLLIIYKLCSIRLNVQILIKSFVIFHKRVCVSIYLENVPNIYM